ncbi:hypothetical protein SAMN05444414_12935 [Roseovarius marisflavi]|uniref:Uncharacterized protein n=1 Tax=Roseovarius marisflavi TaxID=1054996 RepID=A0A1M7CSB3_9RHOB|nr:hypothetical protein SAMN05444414_12935 [Roseovarius marisflavi]
MSLRIVWKRRQLTMCWCDSMTTCRQKAGIRSRQRGGSSACFDHATLTETLPWSRPGGNLGCLAPRFAIRDHKTLIRLLASVPNSYYRLGERCEGCIPLRNDRDMQRLTFEAYYEE